MKTLKILLKLRKQVVDEHCRKMALIADELRLREEKLETLDQRYENEREIAHKQGVPEGWSRFVKGYHIRKIEFRDAIREQQSLLDSAQKDLAVAFQELKSIEIYEEQLITEQQKKEKSIENQILEEISLRPFCKV